MGDQPHNPEEMMDALVTAAITHKHAEELHELPIPVAIDAAMKTFIALAAEQVAIGNIKCSPTKFKEGLKKSVNGLMDEAFTEAERIFAMRVGGDGGGSEEG